jgi:hypothetical protein
MKQGSPESLCVAKRLSPCFPARIQAPFKHCEIAVPEHEFSDPELTLFVLRWLFVRWHLDEFLGWYQHK